LIHIDYESQPDPNRAVGRTFCRVVNSFLARRDPAVAFKVGARPYSWGRELRLAGSDARLELGRDFQQINLDEVLERRENRSAWIFPTFAKDVAARRIGFYFKADTSDYDDWLEGALEKLPPNAELGRYGDGGVIVPRLGQWPTLWTEDLIRRSKTDAFSALLEEVWLAQHADRDGVPAEIPKNPRTTWGRPYFIKERKEALLSQIASERRQRRLYAGWDAILTLSGGNILVFLSLCREMWDLAQRTAAINQKTLESAFKAELQSQAIWNVSSDWLRKQDELSGGAFRRRFITRIGTGLRRALMSDKKLSNPGRTGFSLSQEELESDQNSDIRLFLDEATDFGALVRKPHTSKEKDRRPRVKWYISPVLCPNFDLPAVRTKEPYYATIDEVRRWIQTSDAVVLRDMDTSQQTLFR